MTIRARWFERVTLLAALAFAGVAAVGWLLPSSAQETQDGAQSAQRPELWSSEAAASAINLNINSEPRLIPIDEFINFDIPFGQSSWTSTGSSKALAAAVWPGRTVVQGPALMCEFFGGCPDGFPPGYPLHASASQPASPDASAPGASAHAGAPRKDGSFVETSAGASEGLKAALEPLAAVADPGTMEAKTSHRFVEGVLVARAETRLNDVSLFDGVVHIDAIEVVSVSKTDGDEVLATDAEVTVAGVTVQDQPAKITQDGIVISDQGGGAEARQAANDALQQALADSGASIRLLDTFEATEGKAHSTAGGLVIEFRRDVSGPTLPSNPVPQAPLPDGNSVYRTYFGWIKLGSAATTASASSFDFGGDFGGGFDDGGFDDGSGSGQSDTGTSEGGGFDSTSGSDGSAGSTSSSSSGDLGVAAGGTSDEGSGDTATEPSRSGEPSEPEVADGRGQANDQQAASDEPVASPEMLSDDTASGVSNIFAFGAVGALGMFLLSRLPALLSRGS